MIGKIWRWMFGCRHCRRYQEAIEQLSSELKQATKDQVEAMRTLSSFRRQYHDGTGAIAKEAFKLRKEVARLKTRIDKIS